MEKRHRFKNNSLMPRRRVISGDTEWNPLVTGSGDFWNPEPTPIPRSISGGSPRAPTPTPTRAPSPTPTAPDVYENEQGVFKNYPSATIFPDGPDFAGFQGDDFYSGDFESPREPSYSHTSAVGTPRLEPSFLFGSPSVETPTASGRGATGNLDAEPSLFPNPNEWWKGEAFAGATSSGSLSNSEGGSIWGGDDTMGDFIGGTSLGSDLSADLGSMNFGDRPAIDAPSPDEMAFNQPPPPGPIEETFSDQWTTAPGDRRFLPNAAGEPTVETPVSSGRGGDISSFGTYGNPLTLGSFFGHSLEALRFGTDRYQPQITSGGRPPDLQPGEGYIPRDGEGGTWVERPDGSGSDWRENATANPNPRNDGTGTTIIPIGRDATPGTATAFSDPDTYYAGTYFDYGTGHYQHLNEPGSFRDSPNQGAEAAARSPVKFGQNPASDSGHTLFNPGSGWVARLNAEGGFEMVQRSGDTRTSEEQRYGRLLSNLRTSARGRAQTAGPAYGGTGG